MFIKKISYLTCIPVVFFLFACKGVVHEIHDDNFVTVAGSQFLIGGQPYVFVGTNLWYAAYLGSANPEYGDRDRLLRELDFLKSKGITNLRILGSSERSVLRDAMRPAINFQGEVEREDILIGLDFTLAEMAKRNMKAVIFLNNFWEWSGGMATYLSWVNGGDIVDMADPEKPWPAFALFSATFYANEKANALYRKYINTLITRINTLNGRPYRDDPTIMAWQLANEPRPGDGEVSKANLPAYYAWIKATAAYIKSLAPRHLVSIGSEGTMGCINLPECVLDAHKNTGIDYFTFHMWLKNWGWFDVQKPGQTYASALDRAEKYIDEHVTFARQLNMPAVLEEFGLERDQGLLAPATPTTYRDQYYEFVFSKIEESIERGGPLAGSNFWAWGGFGRAVHDDALWRRGDKSFVGDPPQEPQGLNSVFTKDESTLTVIAAHATRISSLVQP